MGIAVAVARRHTEFALQKRNIRFGGASLLVVHKGGTRRRL